MIRAILQGLLEETGASRVTLRRGEGFPVVEEVLAPGVQSIAGERTLNMRTQPVAIEFAGDVMRRVIRSRRAGAAPFQSIRSEIRDHLSQAIDAGCAGTWLLGEGCG